MLYNKENWQGLYRSYIQPYASEKVKQTKNMKIQHVPCSQESPPPSHDANLGGLNFDKFAVSSPPWMLQLYSFIHFYIHTKHKLTFMMVIVLKDAAKKK